MTSATSTKEAVKDSGNWRDAVVDIIGYYTANNMCFSSGEIAAELRTHRTDLRFSVLNLGEYVRDLFYNSAIKYVDDDGDEQQAVQASRTTSGVGRTPAGRLVFVYGPEAADANAHDFEVDIPNPGAPATAAASPIKPKGGYPTAVDGDDDEDEDDDGTAMTASDKLGSGEFQATVHVDKRLCITRPIFDKFIQASGKTLRGGDSVYIVLSDDEARITIEDPNDDDAVSYDLSKERGRVLFRRKSNEFAPGDHYKVTVEKAALIVDLSAPLD